MSSSSSPENTWLSLIDPFQRRLSSYNQTPISSEEEFRTALRQLCEEHREWQHQRLIARIRKQHSSVIDIARGIDSALGLTTAAGFTALVWKTAYTAIHAALASNQDLATFIEKTKKLNVILPSLNRDHLKKYHDQGKVREPLRQMFKSYMETYLTIFSKTAPPTYCPAEFDAALEGKKALFDEQELYWKKAFTDAQDEEQKRLQKGYNSSLGHPGERTVVPATNFSFAIIRELGQGGYGRVYEVKQLPNGDLFARKFVRAPNANQDNGHRQETRQRVVNEVKTSKKLQHHHIASILLWTEDLEGFSLIMPTVADCDLRVFLESCINDNFPKEQIDLMDPWFGCLTTALRFAHANKVKHDDLKPSNILIKDNRVYLADFGCATNFEGSQISSSPEQRITGTPVYRPPDTGKPGRAGDVFALGCVFSEMLTVRQNRTLAAYQAARKVDDADNPYAYRKNLTAVQNWLTELPDTKKGTANVLLGMVLIMLKEDPDDRETAKELKARLNETLFCGSCV